MKFPLLQPLRRNGQRMKPPGDVELDVETDRDDIERLARRGVIGAPEQAVFDADPSTATDKPDTDDATREQDGASAATDDGAEVGVQPEPTAEPEPDTDDATPEQDGASAATDDGAEVRAQPEPIAQPKPAAEPEPKPARKATSKSKSKAKE